MMLLYMHVFHRHPSEESGGGDPRSRIYCTPSHTITPTSLLLSHQHISGRDVFLALSSACHTLFLRGEGKLLSCLQHVQSFDCSCFFALVALSPDLSSQTGMYTLIKTERYDNTNPQKLNQSQPDICDL